MRDPARQEQRRVGDVARIHAARPEEVAGVVERHQHHDQSPQQIDAVEARPGFGVSKFARNGGGVRFGGRAP
jgi:hypothetical protein